MNKIISSLVVLLIIYGSLTAQEEKGKYALELNLNPASLFDASAGAMFQMPNIKGRYFFRSDFAFRLGLGLGFSNNKDYTDADGNEYFKTSSANISLIPGIEKEFGDGKFVGYIGGDLPITSYSDKSEVKIGNTVTKTKNPSGVGYLGIGLNLVIGFDYYLLNSLYIGAELAPGFMFRKYSDTMVDDAITDKGGTNINFNLSSSSGIRLGVRF